MAVLRCRPIGRPSRARARVGRRRRSARPGGRRPERVAVPSAIGGLGRRRRLALPLAPGTRRPVAAGRRRGVPARLHRPALGDGSTPGAIAAVERRPRGRARRRCAGSTTHSRSQTVSSSRRSCETMSSVAGDSRRNDSSASRAGMSRWLVGSSRSSRFAGATPSSASSSRERSPPDSSLTGLKTSSPRKRKRARYERAGPVVHGCRGQQRVEHRRAGEAPVAELGQVAGLHVAPDADEAIERRAARRRSCAAASSCPPPLGPTMPIRSPRRASRRSTRHDAARRAAVRGREPDERRPRARRRCRPERAGRAPDQAAMSGAPARRPGAAPST